MTDPSGIIDGRRTRVAIVGGGLAGMAAAEALVRSGAAVVVTLLESRRSTGGRANSFVDPASGEAVDYCQHVAMGCCTNFLELMQRCGLSDFFERFETLTFHHPGYRPSRFAASRLLPPPLHLLPALGRLAFLTSDERRQIRRAMWRLMRTPTERLRDVPAGRWLRNCGQSQSAIDKFWDVVISGALGEAAETVSTAAARKVFVDGFLASREASHVIVPKLPLRELFGRRLPQALEARGVSIMPQSRARRIALSPDDTLPTRPVIELDDSKLVVDHVIVAVPWHRVAAVISPTTAERAGLDTELWAAFPASPISGVHLWLDRPITDQPHAVLVGTLAQWLFPRTEGAESAAEHYYQVVISAAHSLRGMTAEKVTAEVMRELAEEFPEAAETKLLRSRVVTDPQAVFSIRPEVDAARPPSFTKLSSVHLAGDFVQTGWPATMEGAVISGLQAANSVLRQIKHSPVAISSGLPRSWLSRLVIRV